MAIRTLFKSITVVDKGGPHHLETVDLLYTPDSIEINPSNLEQVDQVIEEPGLHVSAGWIDIGTGVGEPGLEHRETLSSVQEAGLKGGFTRLFLQPDSSPVLDTRASVSGVLAKAKELQRKENPTKLDVIGVLSKQCQGESLAELGDMNRAGITLFGDGLHAIQDAKLLDLALGYTQPFQGIVLSYPSDKRIAQGGQIHEGRQSTILGTQGIPSLAETLGLERDLQLQGYRGGRLHIQAISAEESLVRIKQARVQQAGITFAIPVLNLLLTDEAMADYDVNLKVVPPLRSSMDREALLEAITSGEADALVSNHRPLEVEAKRVEFSYAAFGAATLELTYSIAATALKDGILVADYLGRKNRSCIGIRTFEITSGKSEELTFFYPEKQHQVSKEKLSTKGYNVPLQGRLLTGVAFGVGMPGFGFRHSYQFSS